MRLAIAGAGHQLARWNVIRLLAAIARRATIAAAATGALALIPASTAVAQGAPKSLSASASPIPARDCLDTASTIVPARLDDEHLIYVEQETVVANHDGRILVAGAPVFVWRKAGDRYDLLGLDSLFGMVIEPSSKRVRAVPSPLPGRIVDGMRAAALPDGWWLVTFAEVTPAKSVVHPHVVAMWTGETDGSNWRALEKLPAVSATLDVPRFSALAMRDERVRLAAPVRQDWWRRVVLFSRDDGRWTVREDDLGLTDDVAITSTASADLLAVVRPDTTVSGEDHNSLFLYSKTPKGTVWTAHPRLWRGGTNAVHKPAFMDLAAKPLLLWRTGPMFRATSAWIVSPATILDSAVVPIPLPTIVGNMVTSSLGDAGVIAIHDPISSTRDLRLYEYHEPLRVKLLAQRETEYSGLLGMALTFDRLVLIASKAATRPRDPAVISMIETHTWRCQIADARSP